MASARENDSETASTDAGVASSSAAAGSSSATPAAQGYRESPKETVVNVAPTVSYSQLVPLNFHLDPRQRQLVESYNPADDSNALTEQVIAELRHDGDPLVAYSQMLANVVEATATVTEDPAPPPNDRDPLVASANAVSRVMDACMRANASKQVMLPKFAKVQREILLYLDYTTNKNTRNSFKLQKEAQRTVVYQKYLADTFGIAKKLSPSSSDFPLSGCFGFRKLAESHPRFKTITDRLEGDLRAARTTNETPSADLYNKALVDIIRELVRLLGLFLQWDSEAPEIGPDLPRRASFLGMEDMRSLTRLIRLSKPSSTGKGVHVDEWELFISTDPSQDEIEKKLYDYWEDYRRLKKSGKNDDDNDDPQDKKPMTSRKQQQQKKPTTQKKTKTSSKRKRDEESEEKDDDIPDQNARFGQNIGRQTRSMAAASSASQPTSAVPLNAPTPTVTPTRKAGSTRAAAQRTDSTTAPITPDSPHPDDRGSVNNSITGLATALDQQGNPPLSAAELRDYISEHMNIQITPKAIDEAVGLHSRRCRQSGRERNVMTVVNPDEPFSDLMFQIDMPNIARPNRNRQGARTVDAPAVQTEPVEVDRSRGRARIRKSNPVRVGQSRPTPVQGAAPTPIQSATGSTDASGLVQPFGNVNPSYDATNFGDLDSDWPQTISLHESDDLDAPLHHIIYALVMGGNAPQTIAELEEYISERCPHPSLTFSQRDLNDAITRHANRCRKDGRRHNVVRVENPRTGEPAYQVHLQGVPMPVFGTQPLVHRTSFQSGPVTSAVNTQPTNTASATPDVTGTPSVELDQDLFGLPHSPFPSNTTTLPTPTTSILTPHIFPPTTTRINPPVNPPSHTPAAAPDVIPDGRPFKIEGVTEEQKIAVCGEKAEYDRLVGLGYGSGIEAAASLMRLIQIRAQRDEQACQGSLPPSLSQNQLAQRSADLLRTWYIDLTGTGAGEIVFNEQPSASVHTDPIDSVVIDPLTSVDIDPQHDKIFDDEDGLPAADDDEQRTATTQNAEDEEAGDNIQDPSPVEGQPQMSQDIVGELQNEEVAPPADDEVGGGWYHHDFGWIR